MADQIEWLDPWHAIDEHRDRLVAELQRETCPEHCLYGRRVELIGRRCDRDDFLFRVLDGFDAFAIVHLTWHKEVEPDWPATTLYGNVVDVQQRIRKDNLRRREQAGSGEIDP